MLCVLQDALCLQDSAHGAEQGAVDLEVVLVARSCARGRSESAMQRDLCPERDHGRGHHDDRAGAPPSAMTYLNLVPSIRRL